MSEKLRRLKYYQLENGSMIPLGEIRFTRSYVPFSLYGEKAGQIQYDVLLKSGPQFILTKKEFDEINELIRYDTEDYYGLGIPEMLNREFDFLSKGFNNYPTRSLKMLPTRNAWEDIDRFFGKPKTEAFFGDIDTTETISNVSPKPEEKDKDDEESSVSDSHSEPEQNTQFRYRSDWLY